MKGPKRRLLGVDEDPVPNLVHNFTQRLEQAFRNGNPLAPFEVCHIWASWNLPSHTLPQWVVEHLAQGAAEYFGVSGEATAPPARSLDQIFEMAGGRRGRPGAWVSRRRADKNELFSLAVEAVEREARERDTPPFEYLVAANEYEGQGGRRVRVLNKRGEKTDDFLSLFAKEWDLGVGWGRSRARTAKRRLVDKQ